MYVSIIVRLPGAFRLGTKLANGPVPTSSIGALFSSLFININTYNVNSQIYICIYIYLLNASLKK